MTDGEYAKLGDVNQLPLFQKKLDINIIPTNHRMHCIFLKLCGVFGP